MNKSTTRASLFELNGVPDLKQATPLAFQHVVAMIVGCVTPPIIVSGVAGLSEQDSIILIQAALVMSALSTLLQLFPFIRNRFFSIGSGLPVIMGISFAYVPTMQAIAGDFGVGTILGGDHRRTVCQTDPQIFPASDHGNRCIYDRSFLISDCDQLHGRRYFKRRLRFLAELVRRIYHTGDRNFIEPLWKGNLETGVDPDRYDLWLCRCSVLWHG